MNAIHTIQNVTGPTLTIPVPPEFAGQQVEIDVRVIAKKEPWGEGLKRCAGILADDWTEEDDRILEEIYQDRKRASKSRDYGMSFLPPGRYACGVALLLRRKRDFTAG